MSIIYACQCPELKRRCPACISYDREKKPWLPEVLEAIPIGRPVVLPSRLVAAHAELLARIATGEQYNAIAQYYGVSEDALRWYLKRTGTYVSRAALKAQQLRAMAPLVLTDLATGAMTLTALAAKYEISTHAIRNIRQRAAALPKRKVS